MSPYAKFGLDWPSRSVGHRPHTDKQTNKQINRHNAFYMLDVFGGRASLVPTSPILYAYEFCVPPPLGLYIL